MLAQQAPRLGALSLQSFLQRPREELYDLRKDPNEMNNLATDPRQQATLASLRKELEQFRRATHDPWLGEASVFDHERH